MQNVKRWFKDDNSVYLYVVLVTWLIYIFIYGIRILNPLYVDWLLAGGDLTQHYIGWKAFRFADWTFPLGLHNVLSYPREVSVIFTDSIPLFAVFFKLFSRLLPQDFQYFGVWGIMCFSLQAMFTVKILRKYTNSKTFLTFAGIIAVVAPVMIWRMYVHTALAGQWIIIFGLDPIFNHEIYEESNGRLIRHVFLMGVLSSAIHIYFVLMSGIVLAGICLSFVLRYKAYKKAITSLVTYLFSAVAVVWLLGGFTSGMQAGAVGLGGFSFNLNGFLNPQEWSCIFQTLPLSNEYQYEGFAYLGAGCILLLILAILLFMGNKNIKSEVFNFRITLLILFIVSLISVIVAASPVIGMNDKVLVEITLPESLRKLWGIFRASGRIIWIVNYIIVICSLIAVWKWGGERLAIIIVASCCFLQIYDLHEMLISKQQHFSPKVEYESELKNKNFWKTIADNTNIKHIVFTNPSIGGGVMYSFADWATDNHKTINTFYFARSINSYVEDSLAQAHANLSEDNLYMFFETNMMECYKYNLHYYFIDGYYVGYINPIDGFDEFDINEMVQAWTFGDNRYLQEGEGIDTEEGRVIYPGGLSYGPYWRVPEGEWIVSVNGSGLSGTDITVCSQYGECHHDINIPKKTNEQLTIGIKLTDTVSDLEILVRNTSEVNITLSDMSIRRANY